MTTFSQIGGMRVGNNSLLALNATWPFASLQVDDSILTLGCLGQEWVFPKSSIQRLSKYSGLFSVGLRVEHSNESYDKFIVFWTVQFTILRQELEKRGYSVS
jgi:uncharacterized FAD-dependent dehydrogenase